MNLNFFNRNKQHPHAFYISTKYQAVTYALYSHPGNFYKYRLIISKIKYH